MSNETQTLPAIDPRNQTEVHPDVVAEYVDPRSGAAFLAPHGELGTGYPVRRRKTHFGEKKLWPMQSIPELKPK
jgi:hypothetical protein